MVNDEYFKFRFYNNIKVKSNKTSLLNQKEKELLINCLNKVAEPFIIDEITKFINDKSYTIDLTKKLNKYDFNTKIDYLYPFTEFLYENYKELFIDNNIYQNLTELFK